MKTTKLKKVLIALDYDPTAKKVAELGFLFAKSMNAKIVLLHIIADSTYYSAIEYTPIVGSLGISETEVSEFTTSGGLKKATKHYLDKMKDLLEDSSIETIVKEGDFADTILAVAKSEHADAIVMGSHSRRWFDEILMGSVTEKVLQGSSIPLFIIPIKKHD
ncbi:MAG: universal stress protein [Bacteroidota bacterium]